MTEDDDGVLPLPSLMEAWRPPAGGKRSLRGGTLRIRSGGGKGIGGSAAAPMLSPAEARAKLERIVRKAPEVMVKISGKQRGARHLAEHFGYISRHGKLEVRSSEGEIITDEKRLKAIAADWDMLDQAMNPYGKERPTSMSMVLSMPGGTMLEVSPEAADQFVNLRVSCEGSSRKVRIMMMIGHLLEPGPDL